MIAIKSKNSLSELLIIVCCIIAILTGCSESLDYDYTGDKKSGKPHGYGTMVFKNGDIYIGEFYEGLQHGKGLYLTSYGEYEGSWVVGSLTGEGTYTDLDGGKYTGEFINFNKHGQGSYVYSNGDMYIGGWENDCFYGQGKYISFGDIELVGEFDGRSAYGNLATRGSQNIFTCTFYYTGERKETSALFPWRPSGKGKNVIAGNIYEGEFDDIYFKGTYTGIDGTKYTGEMKEGSFDGLGTLILPNGRVYTGVWSWGYLEDEDYQYWGE